MARINIALGMTQYWQRYARVTIASILLNASSKDEYHFYIMSDCFSQDDKRNFIKLSIIKDAEFEFLEMNNADFEGAIHDWLGVSSSYRLKLSSLTDLDKVLYLDSDLIVLKDINELYSTDVSNYYLAAVEDKMSFLMRNRIAGMNAEYPFINGGVQLMNLANFRKDNLEDLIFEKLRSNDKYTDQDVINDICHKKTLSLPLKYNLMLAEGNIYKDRKEELHEARKAPVIIHYTHKPWIDRGTEFADYWLRYNQYLKDYIDKF